MKNNKDILICDCHSTDHQLVILYEEDETDNGIKYPMCYFHIHLNKRPFWERVKYGINYIFGRQCNYGAFDEFIFNPEDSDKLQKLVDYLKKEDKGGE
jgi:hypothetical protein